MKKKVGLMVLGIVAVVLFLGFMNIQSKKKAVQEEPGSGLFFPDMMNQLSQNMVLWGQMNQEEKKQAVSAVIAIYKNRDNVAILNAAETYVSRIDETLVNDPAVLKLDILTILRVLAIMDYDYYNGQDKEKLARETLGERAYADNQKRRQSMVQV